MEPLPGNSHRSQQEPVKETKKIEPVVQGEVSTRKKGFFQRLRETFLANRADTVGEFIIWDVLIPAVRNTIADGGKTFIDMMLFENGRGRNISGAMMSSMAQSVGQYTNPNQVNYNRVGNPYPGQQVQQQQYQGPSISRHGRSIHDFKEILIPTRVEAEAVIAQLLWHIENYNAVTVADFYQLCNVTPDWTDDKFGWTDIRGTGVLMRGGMYVLDLPRPIQLD